MASKLPTMRDVAQLAGVSVQTVSYVVNETGSISKETRLRVTQAIEQLNYRRDPIARSMRTRQTRLIALLVQDITNPVLSVIASAVEAAAYAEDYNVLLYNMGHDPRREQKYLEALEERLVDGLIIVNAVDHEHIFPRLQASALSIVLIDSLATPMFPSVAVDNRQGAYRATQHLIELGHQRVAHISGALSLEVARQRVAGYTQALADYQLAYQQIVAPHNERWDYYSGYIAMRQLIQSNNPPTAVFAAGDQMAIGACRALVEAGLTVPGDVSVIGFDDIPAATYNTPPLTTIRQPFEEMGLQAFTLLLSLLDGEQSEAPQVTLPAELIVRQSTGSRT